MDDSKFVFKTVLYWKMIIFPYWGSNMFFIPRNFYNSGWPTCSNLINTISATQTRETIDFKLIMFISMSVTFSAYVKIEIVFFILSFTMYCIMISVASYQLNTLLTSKLCRKQRSITNLWKTTNTEQRSHLGYMIIKIKYTQKKKNIWLIF